MKNECNLTRSDEDRCLFVLYSLCFANIHANVINRDRTNQQLLLPKNFVSACFNWKLKEGTLFALAEKAYFHIGNIQTAIEHNCRLGCNHDHISVQAGCPSEVCILKITKQINLLRPFHEENSTRVANHLVIWFTSSSGYLKLARAKSDCSSLTKRLI